MSSQHLQRREFLKTASVAAVIVGYSVTDNAWVTDAHAHGNHNPWNKVPRLDGQLLTDAAARAARGKDVGNIIFNTPKAVLLPASIDDVRKMVKFCKEHRIDVAARGQGHATHGQAQAKAGLVIDMSSMQQIHEIGNGYAIVDGGCTWRRLIEATLATSSPQTPPVLTDYVSLSIGGTLSMGGVSGMAYNIGAQVQQVYELTVVTGEGEVIVCSDAEDCSAIRNRNKRRECERRRELFNHVLAGVGQCGIIVKAKIKLVPAKALALNSTAVYLDFHQFQADMRTLVYRNELDSIFGMNVVDPNSGQRVYLLNVAKFHDTSETPDMATLLAGLSFIPPTLQTVDKAYLAFRLEVDFLFEFVRSIGQFDDNMKPWFDVFMPDSELGDFVVDVVGSFQPDDVGPFGFVLFFPLLTSKITRPLLRLPDEELVWLFNILTIRDAPGYDADYAANKRARNNAWYDIARELGGFRYPIGTMDFSHGDWRRHYGPVWEAFKKAKEDFDPEGILAPGPGIFDRRC